MHKIVVTGYSDDKIYSLIKDNLMSCKTSYVKVKSNFHHNANYKSMPMIVRCGILSFEERLKEEKRSATLEELEHYYNEDCMCRTYMVSVASTIDENKMKKELVHDKIVYGIDNHRVNILLSDDIDAIKEEHNYWDEYLVYYKITPDKFKCFELRLLKHMEDKLSTYKTTLEEAKEQRLNEIIDDYNSIIQMAKKMQQYKLDIPIKEMSDTPVTLDKKKLILLPKIKR